MNECHSRHINHYHHTGSVVLLRSYNINVSLVFRCFIQCRVIQTRHDACSSLILTLLVDSSNRTILQHKLTLEPGARLLFINCDTDITFPSLCISSVVYMIEIFATIHVN